MIKNKIIKLKNLIKIKNLDGYIVPKNDAYFSEYSSPDRLKDISNFSGSAGFAIILRKENYRDGVLDGLYETYGSLGLEDQSCYKEGISVVMSYCD